MTVNSFMSIQQREVGKHQPAHVALEADVGDGILHGAAVNGDPVLGQLHLVDQRIVVAERLRDVACLGVLGGCQLRQVDSAAVALHTRG